MAIIGVALANNANNAERILLSFSCYSSLAPGDLVYQDNAVDEFVIKAESNALVNQVIGICYSKPSPNTARVLILGVYEGYSGLTTGARGFVSVTGTITHTLPSSGYRHNLGIAVSSTGFLFIPNNIRVKCA